MKGLLAVIILLAGMMLGGDAAITWCAATVDHQPAKIVLAYCMLQCSLLALILAAIVLKK